ncbi:hypothetical protein Q8W71_12395 [Methylobacterium sp. NEAU 140]|uniref:hypothetical protein n=1 Tax=Methylobacterium sp. NEAU 140 TaxID=3064945 RepID=UPI002733D41A|nr:hypothetical protein [Methylobacterium sp. NEAU 140]MDP4023429.1 hypothetical protein [Methylobacterium sp. NEAU 140]
MATIRRALILWALVGAGPALAQSPVSVDPGPPGAAAPAATGRAVTGTGQTKPPGAAAGTPLPRPAGNEAAMIKAQKAAEARSKAWDAKMRRTMGSICHGC